MVRRVFTLFPTMIGHDSGKLDGKLERRRGWWGILPAMAGRRLMLMVRKGFRPLNSGGLKESNSSPATISTGKSRGRRLQSWLLFTVLNFFFCDALKVVLRSIGPFFLGWIRPRLIWALFGLGYYRICHYKKKNCWSSRNYRIKFSICDT